MQCKTKLCLILFCDQQTGQRQVWFGEVLFFQCLRYSETLRPLRDGNGQRAYRGEGFSALFTFCPNCPAIISPRILGKIGAVVGVPRACQKFWGFFCLVVCSSLPDGSGRLMEGPTWQTQNVNKAEKHTPKVDAAWNHPTSLPQ